MTRYSVHLIDDRGQGSYLQVKGRAEWKTKRTAKKHALGIAACKVKPWNTVRIEIENEFLELVETIL